MSETTTRRRIIEANKAIEYLDNRDEIYVLMVAQELASAGILNGSIRLAKDCDGELTLLDDRMEPLV